MSKEVEKVKLETLNTLLSEQIKLFDMTYILIDGLDEASPSNRAGIIRALQSYGSKAKVMITSRYAEDILQTLNEWFTCGSCGTYGNGSAWRCPECTTFALCHNCQGMTALQDHEAHKTARKTGWTSIKFEPRKRDVRKYGERRVESDLGFLDLDKNLQQQVVDTVVERSERM